MGLLSLNSNGTSFLLDEDDVVRVTSVSGVINLEHINKEYNRLATIVVDESLATIDAASDSLIELNFSGVPFLLNYTKIVSVTDYNGGAKVIYACVGMEEIAVDETPTEIDNLVRTPSTEPLKYKALLSQNAPIASTNNNAMVAGQIWELSGAAHPSDYATIDTFELVSGTLYAAGSKYRVSIDTPFTLSASAMGYDGAPYVVSTDSNGDLNPFVNTIGNITYSYSSTGSYLVELVGSFLIDKTFLTPMQSLQTGGRDVVNFAVNDDDTLLIETLVTGSVSTDDQLNYTPIELEIYP